MSHNNLSLSSSVTSLYHVTKIPKNFSLYCDFVRNELAWFSSNDRQFTETNKNQTRTWEIVDSAWFEKVFSLIGKSVDNPKSVQRLLAVLDLFRRALADYLVFGSNQVPECVTSDFAESCVETERRIGNVGSSLIGGSTPFVSVGDEEKSRPIRIVADTSGKKLSTCNKFGQSIGVRSFESFSGIRSGEWKFASSYFDAYGNELATITNGSVELNGIEISSL